MKPQTQHMIGVLRTTIRALGFTNREIETRLGVSRGYLTRLFAGTMDLRFDHISDIAEAIGVEPEELLRLAYPPVQKPVAPEVERLRHALGVAPPVEAATTAEPAGNSSLERELERIIAKTFRKMFANIAG
jgi:transcriptional regulator with XRE-family HTH domain